MIARPLPPPPPPPPPRLRTVTVASLNHRWHHGRPSYDLALGGVLMHEFDGSNDPGKPWRWCATSFCRALSDRTSATLVNRRRPHLFPDGCGGFVLAAAHVRQLCSYYSDGGSNRILCRNTSNSNHWSPEHPKTALRDESGQCLPGCGDRWCADATPTKECHAGCAWKPAQLMQMMRQQEAIANERACRHNEVVLQSIARSMTTAIDAVFIKPACLGTGEAAKVKRLHAYLLRRLLLPDALLPFVLYDPSTRGDTGLAFRNATPLVRGDEDVLEARRNATKNATTGTPRSFLDADPAKYIAERLQARMKRRNASAPAAGQLAAASTSRPARQPAAAARDDGGRDASSGSNSELLTLTRLRQENAQLQAENEDLRKNLREAALTWQTEHSRSIH